MAKKKEKQLSQKDYEKLGRMLATIAELGYANHKRLYRIEFFKGVLRGVGTVIGATVIIALLLFVLSILEEVPLIGVIAENFRSTIENP